MSILLQNTETQPRKRAMMLARLAVLLLSGGPMAVASQNTSATSPSPEQVEKIAPALRPAAPSSQPGAIQIDRVVAIVNGDLILESDVDEERRFVAFQPYGTPNEAFSRQDAINRLIDRALILQQDGEQAMSPITDAEETTDILDLRKAIFACHQYHCETDEGWLHFLADNGFTEEEFRQRWRERMTMLRFIEQRFRMGIRIEPAEINQYYQETLLPEYASRHVAPPTLGAIRDRIQEILLQQQVGKLLDDWLKALRASGDVQMVTPGEVAP
jgi:peptidyl-prolyl cis-trans isomerase SurA